MITANFGIEKVPFSCDKIELLPHQTTQYDILAQQAHHGGLIVLEGEPGTGKSIIREYLLQEADTRKMRIVTVKRTLHTYTNVVNIMCEEFGVDSGRTGARCEKNIIQKVRELNRNRQTLITIIDDAQLLDVKMLRQLRLLFEEFPPNHLLLLIGQPKLLQNLKLQVNKDLCSRITHSATLKKLTGEDIEKFILREFDRCGLGHNIFQDGALELIIRSIEGTLRLAKNLCRSCLFEATRKQQRYISTDTVNAVLAQPHWRTQIDPE